MNTEGKKDLKWLSDLSGRLVRELEDEERRAAKARELLSRMQAMARRVEAEAAANSTGKPSEIAASDVPALAVPTQEASPRQGAARTSGGMVALGSGSRVLEGVMDLLWEGLTKVVGLPRAVQFLSDGEEQEYLGSWRVRLTDVLGAEQPLDPVLLNAELEIAVIGPATLNSISARRPLVLRVKLIADNAASGSLIQARFVCGDQETNTKRLALGDVQRFALRASSPKAISLRVTIGSHGQRS